MELSESDIKEINGECPYGQGIFKEPNGIPIRVKEPVVYMRWETGGISGGSCWGTKRFSKSGEPKPKFKALDLILRRLKPDTTFLQFREIEELVQLVDYNDGDDYYGNNTDYAVEYIVLSELLEKLKSF